MRDIDVQKLLLTLQDINKHLDDISQTLFSSLSSMSLNDDMRFAEDYCDQDDVPRETGDEVESECSKDS